MAGERGIIGSVLRDIGTGIVDFAKTKENNNAQARRDEILENRQLKLLNLQQQFQTQAAQDTREFQTEERTARQDASAIESEKERTSRETIAGAKSKAALEASKVKRNRSIEDRDLAALKTETGRVGEKIKRLSERSRKISDKDLILIDKRAVELLEQGKATSAAEAVALAERQIISGPKAARDANLAGLKPIKDREPPVQPTVREQRKNRSSVPGAPPKLKTITKVSREDLDVAIKKSGMSEEALKRVLTLNAQRQGVTLQFP